MSLDKVVPTQYRGRNVLHIYTSNFEIRTDAHQDNSNVSTCKLRATSNVDSGQTGLSVHQTNKHDPATGANVP